MRFEEYLRKLEECGWTADMEPEEARSFRAHPERHFGRAYDLAELDLMVPLLSGFIIDWSVIETREECVEILRTLAAHSRGRFQPAEIGLEMDQGSGTTRVSFELQGRRFAREIPPDHDCAAQFELYRLVNEALAGCGVEQRFIVMPCDGQEGFLVFLAPRAYACAVTSDRLPSSDPDALALDSEAAARWPA